MADKQKSGKVMFYIGLIIALSTAALMFTNIISSGYATVIGIVGIGLIATSNYRPLLQKKPNKIMFYIGIVMAITPLLLMLVNLLDQFIFLTIISLLGIMLIVVSNYRPLLKKK